MPLLIRAEYLSHLSSKKFLSDPQKAVPIKKLKLKGSHLISLLTLVILMLIFSLGSLNA